MTISIIVAIAENGVIGRDNGLPWRLSTDLKRFKALTMGKPIVMGRKTWEGLPKRPLPGRRNIVVTRNPEYEAEGADVFGSLDEALAAGTECGGEVCVVGGGQIYAEALGRADRLHVTHVEATADGDTSFPVIDPERWQVGHEERVPAGEKDDHPTRYTVYERRRSVR
ncbi:MAG: dihydrofolate reductase [Rhizobiaceae bacterium]|nr:dihydrofolate reductase [Rhizobiaceae bacterium]